MSVSICCDILCILRNKRNVFMFKIQYNVCKRFFMLKFLFNIIY